MVRETWGHAELRLADFVGVRRRDRAEDGDVVGNMFVIGGRTGGRLLYVDDIEVVEAPAAELPAASTARRKLLP